MKYTKEQVIEMIRSQHQRDLESLISFIEQVWPEDKPIELLDKQVLEEHE